MCIFIPLLQTMLQHHRQKLSLVKGKHGSRKFLHKVQLSSFVINFFPAYPSGSFVKLFRSASTTYRSEMSKSILIVQRLLQKQNKKYTLMKAKHRKQKFCATYDLHAFHAELLIRSVTLRKEFSGNQLLQVEAQPY